MGEGGGLSVAALLLHLLSWILFDVIYQIYFLEGLLVLQLMEV